MAVIAYVKCARTEGCKSKACGWEVRLREPWSNLTHVALAVDNLVCDGVCCACAIPYSLPL